MAGDIDPSAVSRIFDEATAFARTYQFELTEDYRRLIERVEARPENQTGHDKSVVWAALRRYVESFALVERARNP